MKEKLYNKLINQLEVLTCGSIMEEYTKSIRETDKPKFKEWAKNAETAYNMGLIRSREVVLFQEISEDKIRMLISDKENEVEMSADIEDYLFADGSSLVVTHNHNGTETCFSNRDIEALMDYSRINYIVVINSKQEIFILGKNTQTEPRDKVLKLFWDWWSNSERSARKLKIESVEILEFSPLAMHADKKDYASLLKIEDDVIAALHKMTSYGEFIKFAEAAALDGVYLCG